MNREIIDAAIEALIAVSLFLYSLWPLALAALVLWILWLIIKSYPGPRPPSVPPDYGDQEWGVQDIHAWRLARDNGYIMAPGPRPERRRKPRRSPHAGQWVAIAFIVAGVIVAGGGNYSGGIWLMVIGGAIARQLDEGE